MDQDWTPSWEPNRNGGKAYEGMPKFNNNSGASAARGRRRAGIAKALAKAAKDVTLPKTPWEEQQ